MLDVLVDIVKAESINVVVVAGDIYDRQIPSATAVSALSHGLAEIRGAGATIVGISGNHDSAVRVGFAEPILSAGGVTLRGDIATAGQPVLVPQPDGNGTVAFYPIPYLEPENARHVLGDPEARSHERLLRLALDRARADLATRVGVRSVAIVHAFVTGGSECESELALAVGGSAEVPLKSLRGFDYVALGHLHGRQSLGDGRSRYSGSLLPYSFSEANHVKGAWIVDVPNDGPARVEPIDLPVHRRLSQVRGNLDHLLTDLSLSDAEDHYVQAILTDPLLPLDAMAKLRRRFPDVVVLGHEPPMTTPDGLTYAQRIKGRTDLELALDFVEHMCGCPADAEQARNLTDAIGSAILPDTDADLEVA